VQENVTSIIGLVAHKKTTEGEEDTEETEEEAEEEEAAEEEEEEETSLRGITWIKGLHGLRNG
jgi:ribosomal protein L12E/L44/L45/RPP1/RPP2